MHKKYFLFGMHIHQPFGNLLPVKEGAYRLSYLPTLRVLEGHPNFKFALHISGPLFLWLRQEHPEYINLLKELVHKDQVEIVGGTLGEAILSTISREDALEQLITYKNTLEKEFGRPVNGLWLGERIWDPRLNQILKASGYKYTVLDEYHLEQAKMHNMNVCYKDKDSEISIFPILKKLRYNIPFKQPSALAKIFSARKNAECFTYFDDGEKFGIWPNTYHRVFEERWLNRFASMIENSRSLQSIHFSEYLEQHKNPKIINLPYSSYPEMMRWAKKNFDTFAQKYPESLRMQEKMRFVSRKVRKTNNAEAKKLLFLGEGNDALWHGVFGGIYLPRLRSDVYRNLIKAENLVSKESDILTYEKKLIIEGEKLSIILEPQEGGIISEIDLREQGVNVLNVLSRTPEPYHRPSKNTKIKKPTKIQTIHHIALDIRPFKPSLIYDKHPRVSCVTHILHATSRPSSIIEYFRKGKLPDLFSLEKTQTTYSTSKTVKDITVTFNTKLTTRSKKIQPSFISIKKEFTIPKNESLFHLRTTVSRLPQEAMYASEWNIALSSNSSTIFIVDGLEKNIHRQFDCKAQVIEMIDNIDDRIRIRFEFKNPIQLYHFPIETVSRREGGFELTYQGSALLFAYPRQEFYQLTFSSSFFKNATKSSGL